MYRTEQSTPTAARTPARTASPSYPALTAHAAHPAVSPSHSIGLNRAERFIKRLFDLTMVVVIVALFWWLILGVAIIVRLTTGTPVIFGHTRVGRDGRDFACFKFRSMVPNAEEVLADLLATDPAAREEWARDFKLKNDPRITAFGHFIRKTSLDELPQIWNVLCNDMSIVGPRPVVREELDAYYKGSTREHYLSVKPGLTGLWQVSGRNDMEYAARVTLDREYVQSWRLVADLSIVWRTVGVIFKRTGAY